ncbi:unnamed protein product [Protopolystoma xenopodis]|uniref:Uncharacterized protein n=1 Tax=Protopolystoma xenopodis TaxID=117903 RepID=A0A448XDF9_9PLAT|nr:unnamed protein product [Protopolystoma xenopodis]
MVNDTYLIRFAVCRETASEEDIHHAWSVIRVYAEEIIKAEASLRQWRAHTNMGIRKKRASRQAHLQALSSSVQSKVADGSSSANASSGICDQGEEVELEEEDVFQVKPTDKSHEESGESGYREMGLEDSICGSEKMPLSPSKASSEEKRLRRRSSSRRESSSDRLISSPLLKRSWQPPRQPGIRLSMSSAVRDGIGTDETSEDMLEGSFSEEELEDDDIVQLAHARLAALKAENAAEAYNVLETQMRNMGLLDDDVVQAEANGGSNGDRESAGHSEASMPMNKASSATKAAASTVGDTEPKRPAVNAAGASFIERLLGPQAAGQIMSPIARSLAGVGSLEETAESEDDSNMQKCEKMEEIRSNEDETATKTAQLDEGSKTELNKISEEVNQEEKAEEEDRQNETPGDTKQDQKKELFGEEENCFTPPLPERQQHTPLDYGRMRSATIDLPEQSTWQPDVTPRGRLNLAASASTPLAQKNLSPTSAIEPTEASSNSATWRDPTRIPPQAGRLQQHSISLDATASSIARRLSLNVSRGSEACQLSASGSSPVVARLVSSMVDRRTPIPAGAVRPRSSLILTPTGLSGSGGTDELDETNEFVAALQKPPRLNEEPEEEELGELQTNRRSRREEEESEEESEDEDHVFVCDGDLGVGVARDATLTRLRRQTLLKMISDPASYDRKALRSLCVCPAHKRRIRPGSSGLTASPLGSSQAAEGANGCTAMNSEERSSGIDNMNGNELEAPASPTIDLALEKQMTPISRPHWRKGLSNSASVPSTAGSVNAAVGSQYLPTCPSEHLLKQDLESNSCGKNRHERMRKDQQELVGVTDLLDQEPAAGQHRRVTTIEDLSSRLEGGDCAMALGQGAPRRCTVQPNTSDLLPGQLKPSTPAEIAVSLLAAIGISPNEDPAERDLQTSINNQPTDATSSSPSFTSDRVVSVQPLVGSEKDCRISKSSEIVSKYPAPLSGSSDVSSIHNKVIPTPPDANVLTAEAN